MTEQEKRQLVEAVITQLKNEGTDVSSASVVEDVNGVSYVLCYDTNGNIVRVSPDTINQQESTNKTAIEALGKKVDDNGTDIANETKRAQDAEQALGMALQNGLNQEATARDNLAKEIKSNAMQYDTLGVYVRADKAEIYGRSIDTTPRVVEFPAATTEKAGVMSAADKRALDNVDNKINQAIADIVDSAPESFDTLKEVATWIEDDKTGAAAMAQAISNNTKIINEEKERSLKADTELINAINKEAERVDNEMAQAKTKLVNGDIIVGQAREIYSRTGKVDSATFLKRTTAGGTSIGGGVATLKQVGGNIVKNLVEGRLLEGSYTAALSTITVIDGVAMLVSDGRATYGGYEARVQQGIVGHIYYAAAQYYRIDGSHIELSYQKGYDPLARLWEKGTWLNASLRDAYVEGRPLCLSLRVYSSSVGVSATVFFTRPLLIDLTEMFGAGNEPSKEECDKLFGTMDALPQGLTIAQPTSLKSTGFNQWNPENVLINKTITDNAIVDGDRNIAVIECLPCKTGTGENNGYVIGYGEGDTWSDEGIEVYLTPLNPMEVDGELYLQKLDKDATYGTYVPQIKGYLIVVTPTTDKLCAHLHWSGDRATTDYEPYVESSVALPVIPEMDEWGLAGIQASGTMAQDTIDLENNTYTKRIARISLSSFSKIEMAVTARVWRAYTGSDGTTLYRHSVSSSASHLYYTPEERNKILNGTWNNNDIFIANNGVQYTYDESKNVTHYVAQFTYPDFAPYVASMYKVPNVVSDMFIADSQSVVDCGTVVPSVACLSGRLYISSPALKDKDETALKSLLNNSLLYYELATPEEYPIVTKAAPNYIGSDYGVEQFDSVVPCNANNLYYMRSLAGETRNFLDRLMAGLGTDDVTAIADRIITALSPAAANNDIIEEEV